MSICHAGESESNIALWREAVGVYASPLDRRETPPVCVIALDAYTKSGMQFT